MWVGEIMKMVQNALPIIGGLCAIVLIFSLGAETMAGPPKNLLVLADHKHGTYISPECLWPGVNYETENFEVVTFNVAASIYDYEPDSICTSDSLWPSRNMIWNYIGTKLGILKPLNWKWNEDGTWKDEIFE